MVEGAHQVLDGISSNQRQTIRGGLDPRDVVGQLSRPRIALGPDFIGSGVNERSDLSFEIT